MINGPNFPPPNMPLRTVFGLRTFSADIKKTHTQINLHSSNNNPKLDFLLNNYLNVIVVANEATMYTVYIWSVLYKVESFTKNFIRKHVPFLKSKKKDKRRKITPPEGYKGLIIMQFQQINQTDTHRSHSCRLARQLPHCLFYMSVASSQSCHIHSF